MFHLCDRVALRLVHHTQLRALCLLLHSLCAVTVSDVKEEISKKCDIPVDSFYLSIQEEIQEDDALLR